jgi:hypothetical protein
MQIEVEVALKARIAYKGLQRQEEPSADGIVKGSWHTQAPEFFSELKVHRRDIGHWHLLVPT